MIARPESPARPSREEKKARTRAQLIDAAATVFARRGYMAASLDEVAEEAGLTKGAVYSNFENKEDLFQAVLDDRLNAPIRDMDSALDEKRTVAERAMEGARLYTDMVQQERELFLLALEHTIYAARHQERAPEFTTRSREQLASLADFIEAQSRKAGVRLPFPPAEMAVAAEAISQGMALQRLVDPDSVPDDLLGRLYALLFRLPDED